MTLLLEEIRTMRFSEVDACMLERRDADEHQLIGRAKQGDMQAFGELYQRYLDTVFRYVYRHAGNLQDAEDLTEETFLRVWRSIHRFEDTGRPFVVYLYRVARNTLIDFVRRPANHKTDDLLDERDLVDPRPDPGDTVLDSIEFEELRCTLDQLRDEYQTVLALRFFGELSTEEVALIMERSPGAVRVLQHRALAALRRLLN